MGSGVVCSQCQITIAGVDSCIDRYAAACIQGQPRRGACIGRNRAIDGDVVIGLQRDRSTAVKGLQNQAGRNGNVEPRHESVREQGGVSKRQRHRAAAITRSRHHELLGAVERRYRLAVVGGYTAQAVAVADGAGDCTGRIAPGCRTKTAVPVRTGNHIITAGQERNTATAYLIISAATDQAVTG